MCQWELADSSETWPESILNAESWTQISAKKEWRTASSLSSFEII